jgi:hypothetical protein
MGLLAMKGCTSVWLAVGRSSGLYDTWGVGGQAGCQYHVVITCAKQLTSTACTAVPSVRGSTLPTMQKT